MDHAFILTGVDTTPYSNLYAKNQSRDRANIPVDNVLGHFYNFSYANIFTWEKRHLADKHKKKFVCYFIQMPIPTTFNFGQDVVDSINHDPNTYLLLFSMLEGVVDPVDLNIKLARKGINASKCIVLCSNKLVDRTRQYGVLYLYVDFWESHTRYHQQVIANSSEMTIRDRKKSLHTANKKFLCLNRNIKNHRIWFYYLMHTKDIIDQGHVSYHLPRLTTTLEYRSCANEYNTTKYIPQHLEKDYKLAIRRINARHLDRIDREIVINYNSTILPYYKDSLCSIITESDFRIPFLTEKTYKAIVHCHPFFIIGNPDHHKLLREKGYYTFEDFFETEQVTNWQEAEMFLDKLCNTDIADIKAKVRNIMPKLRHNYNNFFQRKTDWNDIQKLLDKVTDER